MVFDESKLAAEQERKLAPARAREAGVPARKACSASCEAPKSDCTQTAPGIVVSGFSEHIACHPIEVAIDCCPAIKTDKLAAVIAALGWKDANPDQRRAIGWLVVRAVQMTPIVEALPDDFPAKKLFTSPSASLASGNVVLDYWSQTFLRPHYVHHQTSFHADGTLETKTLEDLEVPNDPQLARKQAIEAAKAAGVISGSGSSTPK